MKTTYIKGFGWFVTVFVKYVRIKLLKQLTLNGILCLPVVLYRGTDEAF